MSNNFDQAFARLTAAVKSHADGSDVIRHVEYAPFNSLTNNTASFNEDICQPFESMTAPRESHALRDFAKVFEGVDSQTLFLRLDGPAIYLVISTVLQFPPSSLLEKTVYFFMDILNLYADDTNATKVLQSHVDQASLEQDIIKRQGYIFSRLIPGLKRMLFTESRPFRVRRLIAQMITGLCLRHPRGWKEVMKAQEGCLFGALFNYTTDYTLRILVADMIRQLLINNFEHSEIWEHSREQILDFPTADDLNTKTIVKLLDAMGSLDARQAFHGGKPGQLYLITEVDIPDIHYRSALSDTFLAIDDHLALLIPDQTVESAIFAVYNIFISPELLLEDLSNQTDVALLQIRWTSGQGHIFVRGKKKAVLEIRLTFAQTSCKNAFLVAFNTTRAYHVQHSWPTLSQLQFHTPKQPRMTIYDKSKGEIEVQSEDVQLSNQCGGWHASSPRNCRLQTSSGVDVEEAVAIGDVSLREKDVNDIQRSQQAVSLQKRESETTPREATFTSGVFLSDPSSYLDQTSELSSPLKTLRKGRGVVNAEFLASATASTHSILNSAMDQDNDDDYASFINTASRANASSVRQEKYSASLEEHVGEHQDQNTKTVQKSRATESSTINPRHGAPTAQDVIRSFDTSAKGTKIPEAQVQLADTSDGKSKAAGNRSTPSSAQSEQDFSLRSSIPGSRVAPESKALAGTKRDTVPLQGIDWDDALRSNDQIQKRQRLQPAVNMSCKPTKSPLKNGARTSRRSTSIVSFAPKNMAKIESRARGGSVHTLVATIKTPTRRSECVTAEEPKTHAESLTPGPDIEGHNDSDRASYHGTSNTARWPKSAQSGKLKSKESNVGRTGRLISKGHLTFNPNIGPASKTLSRAQGGRPGLPSVEVPSSDPINHSDGIQSRPNGSSRRSKRFSNEKATPNTDESIGEVLEILEDSYPHEESTTTFPMIEADKSFGTKLSSMIQAVPTGKYNMAIPVTNPTFGDRTQFIHNVNAAKKLQRQQERSRVSTLARKSADNSADSPVSISGVVTVEPRAGKRLCGLEQDDDSRKHDLQLAENPAKENLPSEDSSTSLAQASDDGNDGFNFTVEEPAIDTKFPTEMYQQSCADSSRAAGELSQDLRYTRRQDETSEILSLDDAVNSGRDLNNEYNPKSRLHEHFPPYAATFNTGSGEFRLQVSHEKSGTGKMSQTHESAHLEDIATHHKKPQREMDTLMDQDTSLQAASKQDKQTTLQASKIEVLQHALKLNQCENPGMSSTGPLSVDETARKRNFCPSKDVELANADHSDMIDNSIADCRKSKASHKRGIHSPIAPSANTEPSNPSIKLDEGSGCQQKDDVSSARPHLHTALRRSPQPHTADVTRSDLGEPTITLQTVTTDRAASRDIASTKVPQLTMPAETSLGTQMHKDTPLNDTLPQPLVTDGNSSESLPKKIEPNQSKTISTNARYVGLRTTSQPFARLMLNMKGVKCPPLPNRKADFTTQYDTLLRTDVKQPLPLQFRVRRLPPLDGEDILVVQIQDNPFPDTNQLNELGCEASSQSTSSQKNAADNTTSLQASTAPPMAVCDGSAKTGANRPMKEDVKLGMRHVLRGSEEGHHEVSVIRLRQRQASPTKSPAAEPAPIGTPQPFHEHLHANTYLTTAGLSTQHAVRTPTHFQDQLEYGETTLVDSISQNFEVSNDRFSASPTSQSSPMCIRASRVQKAGTNPRKCLDLENKHPKDKLATVLQEHMKSATQNISIRIENEEKLLRSHVVNYHTSCLQIVENLKQNANARLQYDTIKVLRLLRTQQELVNQIKMQIPRAAIMTTPEIQVSTHLKDCEEKLTTLLDTTPH